MARDLNHVSIIGRLVKDPEIKYTTSGMPVTKFSIANNVSFMQNEERKDYANYFDINVWGNQAVNCEKYLKKGSQVAILGNLRQNRWNDKTTGQTRSKVEITANSVQFLTPISGAQTNNVSNIPVSNIPVDNQPNVAAENTGIIQDPWSENNEAASNNDPYPQSMNNNVDDIPF
ncbi:MAG: single-stranded DNA-binding protein [Spirochaetes bacterium]|nr:single-stranded DNA-binding protein [Spirochaetota bacterium]